MSVYAARQHYSGACGSVHETIFLVAVPVTRFAGSTRTCSLVSLGTGRSKTQEWHPHLLESLAPAIRSQVIIYSSSVEPGQSITRARCLVYVREETYRLWAYSDTATSHILALAFCTSFSSGKSLSQSRIRSTGIVSSPTIDSA